VDRGSFRFALTSSLGHIGMVVARDAPKIVWGKLSEWVRG